MNFELFLQVLDNLFTFQVLLVVLLGVIGGIIIGALPGLGATIAIALMIPVTFGMDSVVGLTMLVSIYAGAIYGGSISAILISTPGTPSSAATSLDGYQLTLQGKGAKALGVATVSSMIGGFISALVLLFLAPPLSKISIMFGPPEYFLIAIFGLTIIGGLSAESLVKGLTGGVIGLLIGTVGMDQLTGVPRFTFGSLSLYSGVPIIAALIGLFSLSQVMIQAEKYKKKIAEKKIMKVEGKVLPTLKEFKEIFQTIIRSSGIGTFVGILPGAGADIGSWVSYNEAKRFSKNKKAFGKGSIEGVAASEAGNNSVVGGSLIPMLTLGIPGNVVTAVLLGGLIIQGLTPGHELFTTHANVTYSMIIGFLIANIIMGIIGLLGAKYFVKVSKVSDKLLAPIIISFSVVGAYVISNNIFDIWIMIIFGLIGYLIRKTGFHPAPIVLGIILGPIGEAGFRQSLVMAKESSILAFYLTRPISVILIVLTLITIFSPLISKMWKRRKIQKIKSE